MSTRLFDGKEHASYYQKFRPEPAQQMIDLIFSYLDERLPESRGFAVDVGCGTGQCTRILSPYFQKVLGIDISDAQIEEARKFLESPNITYSVCAAEELPVDDASVDVLTASTSVHWFNIEKFLKEADRILKPGGCLAFFSHLFQIEVHYKDCSEQMTRVYLEVLDILAPYMHEKYYHVKTSYKDIFEAVPYTEKQRIEGIVTKIPMPLAGFIGLIQTFSAFQIYLRTEPDEAKEMIRAVEERFLQIMGTSSGETKVEVRFHHVLVLTSKPQ